jgi:hypothetical protein
MANKGSVSGGRKAVRWRSVGGKAAVGGRSEGGPQPCRAWRRRAQILQIKRLSRQAPRRSRGVWRRLRQERECEIFEAEHCGRPLFATGGHPKRACRRVAIILHFVKSQPRAWTCDEDRAPTATRAPTRTRGPVDAAKVVVGPRRSGADGRNTPRRRCSSVRSIAIRRCARPASRASAAKRIAPSQRSPTRPPRPVQPWPR